MKKYPLSINNYAFPVVFALLLFISCSKKETAEKNSDKAITSFSFPGLNPAVSGQINEGGKTIAATVPAMTNLANLIPEIGVSAGATISPKSGTAQDFSKPVTYTVTAQDGSQSAYIVNVALAPAATQDIPCAQIPNVLEDLGEGVDYIIKCNISLTNGKVLEIKPGVRIQFEGADAGITVSDGAALKMVGTAAKPIILEGKNATAGSWQGVQLASANINNRWEYVTIQHAGSNVYGAGLLIADHYTTQASSATQVAIRNCTFKDNKGYGIWEYDNKYIYPRIIFSEFENNTFTNNSLSALKVTIDAIGKLDAQSTYKNNGQAYIEVTGLNGLHNNTTVKKLDVPYVLNDFIFLYQKLVVQPGVTLQFNVDAGLILDNSGTLIANGTAADPIKFIGNKAGKGYWLGLALDTNDPEILLNYCVVDGAGSNQFQRSPGSCNYAKAAISLKGCGIYTYSNTASVTNCTITNSGGYGITYKNGSSVVMNNNAFSGNTSYDIFIQP